MNDMQASPLHNAYLLVGSCILLCLPLGAPGLHVNGIYGCPVLPVSSSVTRHDNAAATSF